MCTRRTDTRPPQGDEWRLRCLCVWCVCISQYITQGKGWVMNKECLVIRKRTKIQRDQILPFGAMEPDLINYFQWPQCTMTLTRGQLYVLCLSGQQQAFSPADLGNGPLRCSTTAYTHRDAALLRIFLRGISPDGLTIKGQQNADCKEKAMSRRKGYWYFRSSWLREQERAGGREGWWEKEGLRRV